MLDFSQRFAKFYELLERFSSCRSGRKAHYFVFLTNLSLVPAQLAMARYGKVASSRRSAVIPKLHARAFSFVGLQRTVHLGRKMEEETANDVRNREPLEPATYSSITPKRFIDHEGILNL